MADQKISELPAAAALDGSEQIPVVQGGVTVRTTVTEVDATIPPHPDLTAHDALGLATQAELNAAIAAATITPDYAHWSRIGVPDGTTGSFDFDADLVAPSTIVEYDDSVSFVSNYGWGLPKIIESGWYSVAYRISLAGTTSVGIVIVNETGASPFYAGEPWSNIQGIGQAGLPLASNPGDFVSGVIHIVGGQHIDLFTGASAPGGTTRQDLVIQRVA